MVKVKDTATFIAAARAVHGDKYDYSQTQWRCSRSPIIIGCRNCGPVQLKDPCSHYKCKVKSGCKKCKGIKVTDTQSFIDQSKVVWGDKYDYSQTVYTKALDPVVITCRNCGPIRLASAGSHYGKQASGCRKCEQEETLARKGQAHCCDMCGERVKYTGGWNRCKDCRESLKSEWCVALGLAEQRLKIRCKVNTLDGWNRWAKNKGAMLCGRKLNSLGGGLVLKPRFGNWDNWVKAKNHRLANRKQECKWTKRTRNWAMSLAFRKPRELAVNN